MSELHEVKSFFLVALVGLLVSGCCAPGVVRLMDKPVNGSHAQFNGQKVALIVRDERPETVQKANMVGVNHQTAFRLPVAPIFLAHSEHLDAIIVYHIKQRLENAGYEVVGCCPNTKQLSTQEVSAKQFKAAEKAAWDDKDSQKMSKAEKKAIKKAGKTGTVSVEALDEKTVGPWGEDLNVSGANAVVELKIKKFWTDYSYYGSVSWMSANLAVCSANDEIRKVFYGNKLKGGGYMFSFFTPLTPSSDATVSVNTAYWFVLNGLEKEFSSPGFLNTIKKNSTN